MSKKSELEWLNRDLMTSSYYYALALSEKDFYSGLKQLKVPKRSWPDFLGTSRANAATNFFEIAGGIGQCAIVTMHPHRKSGHDVKQIYAMLVHEAVHIWQAHRDSIGERRPGLEGEAYAVQRIAQSLMFSYDEQTKRRKKK